MTHHRKIVVTDYNEIWEVEFNRLTIYFKQHLGDYIIRVEHVGSTSVKGLAAKPILDIDIVINLNQFEIVKEKLKEIGYEYRGDLGIKGREAFKLIDSTNQKWYPHNLYVCAEDADELYRHTIFRDYLRNHPDVRDSYGKLKKEGAKLHPYDIDSYMDHKGEFIVEHLVRAMKLADYVPNNESGDCPKCGSGNIETNFDMNYLKAGQKTEIFYHHCLSCKKEWSKSKMV